MAAGRPNETSVFERTSLPELYAGVREMYRRYPQPWVIGYSGGKDSTAVLQLIWYALAELPLSQRDKPVFVIASDTRVETPIIVNHIDETLERVAAVAAAQHLPFRTSKVMPVLNDTFWVNLIGRGYPAPTTKFRWCTERMKITPANRFIQEKVAEFGEVIMVLGIRKTESATRMQLMNTYQVQNHELRRHSSLPGAYVYAPIADFSTDDVWKYLLQVPAPWGGDNHNLAAMYRSANQGECPLVIDTSTPSCGNSRFGCWVCTVATRDTSMEGMIDSGETWLEPLFAFREWLAATGDPARKREFRDAKGRDGRILMKKDGTAMARTYKLEVSMEMLERLLHAQAQVCKSGPDPDAELISEEEIHEIRRIWRTERQDWDDTVPRIYERAFGRSLHWRRDDDTHFDSEQRQLLERACEAHDVPFELVAKLLEVERRSHGVARRAGVQKALGATLAQEWRDVQEVEAEHRERRGLHAV